MVLKVLLETGIHFRGVSQAIKILSPTAGSLSHTTVINWVHKIGLYQLTKGAKEKKKAKDWILILDHSIQIGKEKVLVIFGVRESQLKFDRALQFQDLMALMEISKEKWDAQVVANVLGKLKKEIGGIRYAVADHGSDLRKGLKIAGIPQVYDLTHQIAVILKKVYAEDNAFKSLTGKMSDSRSHNQQTSLSHLIPPHQRSKSRFENIGKISDWGIKMIRYLGKPEVKNTDAEKEFAWVKEHEETIKELFQINEGLGKIQLLLKSKGMDRETVQKCENMLEQLKTEKGQTIAVRLGDYFEETRKLFPFKTIVCSSDIIESAFGKYKNYVSKNPMAGITNLVLCIAALTSSLDEKEIELAMKKITIGKVKAWTKKHIGKSTFQKRTECLDAA